MKCPIDGEFEFAVSDVNGHVLRVRGRCYTIKCYLRRRMNASL